MIASVDEISRVLRDLASRLRAATGRRVERVRRAVTETVHPSGVVTGFGADLFRTRKELLAENAALRQQLIVASRKVKKPAFRPLERGLLVAITSRFRTWREAVLLVKPDTILRWHREGFRLLWRHKTRPKKPRKSR